MSDRAVAYLLLTNSGGAVATLSFIGAVESIRSQYAPRVALALFALGLILVGVYTAMRVHYVDRLFAHWRRGVDRFYRDEIDWDTLTREDDEHAYEITWHYIVAYASFACFITGTVVGLVFSSLP